MLNVSFFLLQKEIYQEEGTQRVTANGHGVSFRGDDNIVELVAMVA